MSSLEDHFKLAFLCSDLKLVAFGTLPRALDLLMASGCSGTELSSTPHPLLSLSMPGELILPLEPLLVCKVG